MRRVLFLLFLVFLWPVSALAQDLFLDNGAADIFTPTELEILEKKLGLTEPEKEPFDPQTVASQYEETCMETEKAGLGYKQKRFLCSCTAQRMLELMTPPEIKSIVQNSVQGAQSRNKIIAFGYIPCMARVYRDFTYQNCLRQEEYKKGMRKHKSVCSCIAEGSENVTKQWTGHMFLTARKAGYDQYATVDEMFYFILHNGFLQDKSRAVVKKCYRKFELLGR